MTTPAPGADPPGPLEALAETWAWYRALDMPSWKPPDWTIPLVWTVIFVLMAVAVVRVWRRAPEARGPLIGLVLINLALNGLWAVLFAGLKRPDWSLWETAPLWLSVLILMLFLGRRSRTAGALLLPYLVWTAAAAALNARIVQLNGPFG